MKRGSIEIQFNWIFILIIGALILSFFFVIVQKQKSSSDIKIAVDTRRDLRTIFTGAVVTPGKTIKINLQNTEITYTCEGYSIKNLNPVRQGITFAPSLIKGNSLTTTSYRFSMPYAATSVLLMTSPNIRYILVDGGTDDAADVNRSLPARTITDNQRESPLISKEIVSLTSQQELLPAVSDLNNYRVRLIFFNDNPTALDMSTLNLDMDDKDITAIQIKPDASCQDLLSCFGEVVYYVKKPNNKFGFAEATEPLSTTHYISEASLLGAIYTDDIETYNCNMQENFRRFTLVTDVYINRTIFLSDHYQETGNVNCETIHNVALNELDTNIKSTSETLAATFPADVSDISTLHTVANTLKEANDRAITLGCSEVY